MATMTREHEVARPRSVVLAAALTVLTAVISVVVALAAPDLDDRATILTVSSVLGVLRLAAARGLWTGSRLGAIATLALNALGVLMALPAFFQDDVAILAFNVVELAMCVVAIAAVLRPVARAFWNRRETAASFRGA